MYKNNLAAKILLAVMAASVVGASSAYAAEPFPAGNKTITGDKEYTTNSALTAGENDITGNGTNKVTVTNADGASSGRGVITATGKNYLKITGLDTLTVLMNKNGTLGSHGPDGLVTTDGGNNTGIEISNVNTINIGTTENRLQAGGQAVHSLNGSIKMINIGELNIYTNGQGVQGQNNKETSVDIQANGNVTIDANREAVLAQSLNANPGTASVSINAKGKISLKTHEAGRKTISSGDNSNATSGTYDGNGETHIVISGNQGVDINSDKANAIYMYRKNKNNDSTLEISSKNGDVNINAAQDAIWMKPATEATDEVAADTGIAGKIEGNNINITSKTGSAANITNSSLNLAGNQDNSTITLTGGNGNAVSTTGSNGKLTIGDGTHNTNVIVNGHMKVVDGSSVIASNKTTLIVDSKYLTSDTPFITTSENQLPEGSVTIEGNVKAIGLKTGEALQFSDNKTLDQNIAEKIITDNKLQDITFENNKLIVTTVSKDEAAKMLAGSVVTDVLLQATKDNNTPITDLFTGAGKSNAEQISAINSAANISELGGTSHGTYSMSNIMTDAVADHLSLATHGEQDKDVWAHYIHNKENVSGLALGGVDGNYDAQYNGIVVGSDLYKNGKATVGVALSYAEGNIDGSTLAARTSNDAEYYGASIYGRIDNGDSAVLGDISYLHSKNDIEQTNSGKTITATPKADAFSVGVKAEQVFNAGAAKFVPYAGLRYMHLGVGNYNDSLGLSYNSDEQNLWLLPVGVTYSQDIKAGSWTLRPVVEAGYVWTMGDRDTQQTVSLNGASDGFGFDVADSGSFISRFALEAENANVTYGLGYEYQKGDTVKANKWMANVNFSF